MATTITGNATTPATWGDGTRRADLVDRLLKYENAFYEACGDKSKNFAEWRLHHEGTMWSGLTDEGLWTARFLCGMKVTAAPGILMLGSGTETPCPEFEARRAEFELIRRKYDEQCRAAGLAAESKIANASRARRRKGKRY